MPDNSYGDDCSVLLHDGVVYVCLLRIGLVYDEHMLAHECIWIPTFPEAPSRLKAALDRIREYDLLDRCVDIPVSLSSTFAFRHVFANILFVYFVLNIVVI